MEAVAEHRMPSDRLTLGKRSKPGIEHEMSSYGTLSPTTDYQILMYQLQELSTESKPVNQFQGDDQAFIALQHYADFQAVLSKRLCDDLDRVEIYSSLQPRILLENDVVEGDFPFQKYAHPPLTISPANQLPSPIVIPVKKAEDHGRRLVRAYAPSLMECGINQNTFLHFIDTLNASIRVSFLFLVY
jgi:hypothetical protein